MYLSRMRHCGVIRLFYYLCFPMDNGTTYMNTCKGLLSGSPVASFVPPLQPYMQQGFDFLRTAPEWLQYGILASIAASFGLKSITQLKK